MLNSKTGARESAHTAQRFAAEARTVTIRDAIKGPRSCAKTRTALRVRHLPLPCPERVVKQRHARQPRWRQRSPPPPIAHPAREMTPLPTAVCNQSLPSVALHLGREFLQVDLLTRGRKAVRQ